MNHSEFDRPIRIAVVDDHGIVRFGYSQLIASEPGFVVCGMAENEADGLRMLEREKPDLAIIDLSLKKGSGMDLIDAAARRLPKLKLLVVSAHDENLYARRVIAAGAHGYLNKQEAPDQLINGIHALLRYEFFVSENVKQVLIGQGHARHHFADENFGDVDTLTNRELQVFELIGNGHSTREIADALFVSVKTIERHKENIKHKLGIDHATRLVQKATSWVIRDV